MVIYIHIAASTTLAQAPSFLSRHWKHADTAGGYYLKANTVLLYALDSDARIYYASSLSLSPHL